MRTTPFNHTESARNFRAIDAFNAAHAPGTRVRVDRGLHLPPRTGRMKSRAFLKNGLPAVRVEFFAGIAGTFPLSKVTKAEEVAS